MSSTLSLPASSFFLFSLLLPPPNSRDATHILSLNLSFLTLTLSHSHTKQPLPISLLLTIFLFCLSLSLKTPPLTLPHSSSPLPSQLIYCLAHFKGDEKIPPYIHRLIDPSEVTEIGEEAESRFSQFSEDDYLALLSKNSETLFQDESYMKHLRRHAHKSVV